MLRLHRESVWFQDFPGSNIVNRPRKLWHDSIIIIIIIIIPHHVPQHSLLAPPLWDVRNTKAACTTWGILENFIVVRESPGSPEIGSRFPRFCTKKWVSKQLVGNLVRICFHLGMFYEVDSNVGCQKLELNRVPHVTFWCKKSFGDWLVG